VRGGGGWGCRAPPTLRGVTSAPIRPPMAMSCELHRVSSSPAPDSSPWRPASGPPPTLALGTHSTAASVDLGGSPGTFLTGTRMELDSPWPPVTPPGAGGGGGDDDGHPDDRLPVAERPERWDERSPLPSPVHETSPQLGGGGWVPRGALEPQEERWSGSASADSMRDNPMQSMESLVAAERNPRAVLAADAVHALATQVRVTPLPIQRCKSCES
jgi:hypothetical protein